MEIKWAVVFLLFAILVMTLVEFIALDKKIDKALEQQGKINQVSCEINKDQSEKIRLLQTDANILMNIAINQSFIEEEE